MQTRPWPPGRSTACCPQPFHVAEQFTGFKGKYVKLADTIRAFKQICDGKHDEIPEQAFLYCGAIEEVIANYEKMKAEA